MKMNADMMQIQAKADVVRRAYHSPRLSVLGDVAGLTESGSMTGNEQGMYFGMLSCSWDINPNMQYNMC